MSFISKLFAKKSGGTFIGRLWRSIVDRQTGGILDLMGKLANRDDTNGTWDDPSNGAGE